MKANDRSLRSKKLVISIRTVERLLDAAEAAQMKSMLRQKCRRIKRLNDEVAKLRNLIANEVIDQAGHAKTLPFEGRIRGIMDRYGDLSGRLATEVQISKDKVRKTKVHHRAVVKGYFRPHMARQGVHFDMRK